MSTRWSRYPGTEITAQEARAHRFLLTSYETELRYAWTTGRATSRFLAGLRKAEVWGTKCGGCLRVLVPPRTYCERCFRTTSDWVRVRDTGSVQTYSISYVNADASRRRTPILVAVVAIDGASPGMGLLHLLGRVAPRRVSVGMRVRAVWRNEASRSGSITDIRHFEPEEGRRG